MTGHRLRKTQSLWPGLRTLKSLLGDIPGVGIHVLALAAASLNCSKATEEEIEDSKKKKPASKASAKAKPKAKASPNGMPKQDEEELNEKEKGRGVRSPLKPGEASPNPQPVKRARGKQAQKEGPKCSPEKRDPHIGKGPDEMDDLREA